MGLAVRTIFSSNELEMISCRLWYAVYAGDGFDAAIVRDYFITLLATITLFRKSVLAMAPQSADSTAVHIVLCRQNSGHPQIT